MRPLRPACLTGTNVSACEERPLRHFAFLSEMKPLLCSAFFTSRRPRPCSRSLQTAVLLRVFFPSPPRTLICAFCLPVASAGSHSEKYALPLLSLHARAHCLSRVILATSFSKYPELSRSPPPCLNRSSGTSSTFSANRPPAPLRYLEGFQESYQVVLLLL